MTQRALKNWNDFDIAKYELLQIWLKTLYRSVSTFVYDHEMDMLPAIHYTRYCRKKGCPFQQHYSYYTCGSSDAVIYNDTLDWPYFMCSRETGFSAKLRAHFDSDCLLGQISYKQSADIYNHYNKYEEEFHSDKHNLEDIWYVGSLRTFGVHTCTGISTKYVYYVLAHTKILTLHLKPYNAARNTDLLIKCCIF